ncbi:MAG: hypothetical protein NW200_02775 [Hyphomonadaceae bacterium]|nr:hypothetical protein [Hyphomonadaceae bacterium]
MKSGTPVRFAWRAAHGLGIIAALLALGAAVAHAQDPFFAASADTQALRSVGWRGFLDIRSLAEELAALLLATALGALIAFHPITPRSVDTLEEAELPKVYIMYALVGAVIGVTVLQYGMVVGIVVFGLGGLMRFRTSVDSSRDTGRLIVVTLLGLISGLNLPHFAVLAAVFVYVLIFFLDAQPICRIVVKELQGARVPAAAEAYKTALQQLKCKVLSERKHFAKPRLDIVFRAPRGTTPELLHSELSRLVPPEVRGEIDWEVD